MLSRLSYIACTTILLYVAFIFYPKWNAEAGESSLGYDAATYYWYLPATFIYKDLKEQKFGDSITAKYRFQSTFAESYVHDSGNRVIVFSAGMAVMQLPAFAVAHLLARPLGFDADGFSKPYQVALQLLGLCWAFIGLWFFKKLLLYYFTDATTAITLLLLVLGSNYLNYSGIDVTLTHSLLFTIYVLLLLNTRQFYIRPTGKYAARVGLLTGLLILIRPSEMIAVLIPLLWNMESISLAAIKNKLAFLLKQYRYILLAIGCAMLVGSIQVMYWLYVTGQPFVYSYDFGFSWKSPHFWLYTFSYRSGWLVYTPLLAFAFVGILPFLFKGKNKVAVITFFLLNYYIVAAWDVWWYGGMGGRPMVQSYAVAFLLIATWVEYLRTTKWLKWPAMAIMLVFSYVNIWFTYNAHSYKGLYDATSMTKEYYWAVIGRFNVPDYTVRYKDTDEYYSGEPKNLTLIYRNSFEDDSNATTVNALSGKRSLFMGDGREYSPEMRIPYQRSDADWVRMKATIHLSCWDWDVWKRIVFHVGFMDEQSAFVKRRRIILNNATDQLDAEIYFDVKIPEADYDSLDILIWNPGSSCPVMVDDVELWSFDE